MKISPRNIMSGVTLLLLAIIVIASWKEIRHAWDLLEKVNIWILALLIPVQFVSYYAAGEMMFEYLRSKKVVGHISRMSMARMALELNFVNHILPSGGVSGISYMTWRLGKLGVQPGRATMAQMVRYTSGFLAYLTLLFIAVVFVTLDEGVNRLIILASLGITSLLLVVMIGGIYTISSHARLTRFSHWLTRIINSVVARVTLGRVKKALLATRVEQFFKEIHDDYAQIRVDKRVLIRPYLWGLLFTIADVSLFVVGFWALGASVNPAPIVIAFGLASFAGFILFTPGGAGAYEAIMVTFLAIAGVNQGLAIAGIVLTRVGLLLGTIISGYIFYQLSLIRYGKHST